MVHIAEELQKIAKIGVGAAQDKFDAQEVARPDVLQAEIQLSEVGILLDNARYRERAARQQLANVLGVPQLPQEPLVGELADAREVIDHDWLWEQVCSANPLLESARAEVQRARVQIQRERVEPIPDVQTQFGVQYDAATEHTVANAQVGVALPFHDRNQGNVAAAAARLRRATANVKRLELVLRDRMTETYRRYSIAHNRAERYRTTILPKAKESLELATAAYQAGEYDFLRVLTARRTRFETEVEYVSSLTDLRQSLVELDGFLLTGGLSDPGNEVIDSALGGGVLTNLNQ